MVASGKQVPWGGHKTGNCMTETYSASAIQEIHDLSWNTLVQYRVHKILPLGPILNQMNPVHNPKSRFFKNHFNIILSIYRKLNDDVAMRGHCFQITPLDICMSGFLFDPPKRRHTLTRLYGVMSQTTALH